MRFEYRLIIHACISACGTLALAYFFGKLIARRYSAKPVYAALYIFYFCVNLALAMFVGNVWARGIFGIVFPFAAALLFYSGKILRRVFLAEVVLVFNLAAEPLVAVLLGWATGHIFPEVPAGDAMYFIAAGLATAAYMTAIHIVTYRSKPEKPSITSRQYLVLIIMMLMCLLISYIGLWTVLRNEAPVSFANVVLEICVYSMPVFVFFVFERFQENAHLEMRANILRAQLVQNERQFELMDAHQKEIRLLKHDFSGQIMNMRMMAERSANPEIINYLDDYEKSTGNTISQVVTGLSSIDTVIGLKMSQAESFGIAFEVKVPEISDIGISPVHINNILLNALDNAIEACCALPDGMQRHIELALKSESGYFFIRVINTSLPVVIIGGNFPNTTKADKESHGIGLESISESVKECNGIMDVDYNDGRFILAIRLRDSSPQKPGA